ncbi:PEP-CTERM sorting domain-containing protein [Accumulibacter sp.]|uniref:PEP-CTERM sorting domain-containing protein n=1 Tax=Accumulibacter sp. TaxID=2053492 RepID=UPI0025E57498|nr:PEP-CTERM sorting domain-containing protein [Accumulibacter sp.]MCM8613017.1 PEP-CTERM sorting domain-containing protein [Accumulibacter sp.]MCM8637060.1 PEP-CTERM sorting domain-containing protein [Accumulibacter sp.]MCM8640661.1 PEP-CTERM sorting domain-containing protein [Accumulibacter sp.]
MKTLSSLLASLLLAGASSLANAGTIDFDNLALNNWDPILANYGDHGFGGVGDTRIGVSYSGSSGSTNNLLFWNNDYGDLTKVAFTPTNGTLARISFTADPGWLISSVFFELAGWPNADLNAQTIVAAIGAVTGTFSPTTVQGDFATLPRHSGFGLNTAGASSAYIEWGTDWNIGIDNISFEVIADPSNGVPEPGSLALLATALGLAGFGQRRRTATR